MSGTAPPDPATTLPPLFRGVAVLDRTTHAALRLNPDAGYGFARGTNAVPLALEELALAGQHYPVVFAAGPQPMPVAVVGYRNAENLFVGADGTWQAGRYVPAYLRSYPFVLVQPDPAQDEHVLGLDPDAEALGQVQGTPLLAAGEPTPLLAERMRLCTELRAGLLAAAQFGQALREAGLLAAQQVRLEFTTGGPAQLDGFEVLDAAKLGALPDATVVEWHRRGWLAAAHAALFSAPHWAGLMEQAALRQRQLP